MGFFGLGKKESPAQTPAVPPASGALRAVEAKDSEPPKEQGDGAAFREMALALRKEFPMGMFYIRENGTVTGEPWVVDKIFPVTAAFPDGRTHTVHHIRLSPVGKPSVSEEYLLGDFMEKRLIHEAQAARTGEGGGEEELPVIEGEIAEDNALPVVEGTIVEETAD